MFGDNYASKTSKTLMLMNDEMQKSLINQWNESGITLQNVMPHWRRGGDSNSRWVLPHTRFPGEHLRPLRHLCTSLCECSASACSVYFLRKNSRHFEQTSHYSTLNPLDKRLQPKGFQPVLIGRGTRFPGEHLRPLRHLCTSMFASA